MLEKFKNQVVISVQAAYSEPLYEENAMNAMIKTVVELGGAKALRLAGARDIKNTKKMFSWIPVIGITKPKFLPENWIDEVYITPSIEDAKSIIEAGCDVVAFDATLRNRQVSIKEMCNYIHEQGKLAMGDIATIEDGKNAVECGLDIVSTTLSGYTKETQSSSTEPDFNLLNELVKNYNIPVILEGRIWDRSEVKKAFEIGAYSVVIGSAVTRPQHIVQRFLNYCEVK